MPPAPDPVRRERPGIGHKRVEVPVQEKADSVTNTPLSFDLQAAVAACHHSPCQCCVFSRPLATARRQHRWPWRARNDQSGDELPRELLQLCRRPPAFCRALCVRPPAENQERAADAPVFSLSLTAEGVAIVVVADAASFASFYGRRRCGGGRGGRLPRTSGPDCARSPSLSTEASAPLRLAWPPSTKWHSSCTAGPTTGREALARARTRGGWSRVERPPSQPHYRMVLPPHRTDGRRRRTSPTP
jgi:hypothetical protein